MLWKVNQTEEIKEIINQISLTKTPERWSVIIKLMNQLMEETSLSYWMMTMIDPLLLIASSLFVLSLLILLFLNPRDLTKIRYHIYTTIILFISLTIYLYNLLFFFIQLNLVNKWCRLSLICSLIGLIVISVIKFGRFIDINDPDQIGYLRINIKSQERLLSIRNIIRNIRNDHGYTILNLRVISNIIIIINITQIFMLRNKSILMIIIINTYTIFYNKGKDTTLSGSFKDKGQRVFIIATISWYFRNDSLLWIKIFIFCFETDVGSRATIHYITLTILGSLEWMINDVGYHQFINMFIFQIYNYHTKVVNDDYINQTTILPGNKRYCEGNVINEIHGIKLYKNLLNYTLLSYPSELSFINEILTITK